MFSMKRFSLSLLALLVAITFVSAQEIFSYKEKVEYQSDGLVFISSGTEMTWSIEDFIDFKPGGEQWEYHACSELNFLLLKTNVSDAQVIGYINNVPCFVVAVPAQKVRFAKAELYNLAYDYLLPYVENSILYQKCTTASEKERYLVELEKNNDASSLKRRIYRKMSIDTEMVMKKRYPCQCIGYNPISKQAIFEPSCNLKSLRDLCLDNYILKESGGKYVRENCKEDAALVEKLREKFLKALFGE